MRRIAVIDAETDPFRKGRVPQPFIWGFYDGKRYIEFAETAALADFLYGENCICFAHNGGKFDFHYLLPYLEAYDDIMIINGRIARMQIGLCELRDSMCILPVGLAAYQKEVIDYDLFEMAHRDKPAVKKKISAYLQSDCLYLHQMVSAFIARFGDCLTQAGAAMKQWKKISKRQEYLPLEKTDAEFYAAFSPYYYGGRVECFEAGVIDTDFAVYDINSAYPYAMMQSHPYSATFERLDNYARDVDFVRCRCVSRGALPFRGIGDPNASGSGLAFPRDNEVREFFVTRWEFDAARDTRSISQVEILECVRFTRKQSFHAYIDQFWDERKAAQVAGDRLGDLFAKLLMNSLYGKFAANPDNYSNYIIVPPDKAHLLADDKSPYAFAGELGPWALGSKPLDAESRTYYNVATGASITGFVRAMLWRAIHASKGVLYCDTDSIAVREPGRIVKLGAALGQWKHEGDFDKAGIAGKKLYVFRGRRVRGEQRIYKHASKGVRLTIPELWKVAAGGTVEYQSTVPTYSIHKAPHFVNRNVVKTTKGSK